jgi:ankyrin repeat protein
MTAAPKSRVERFNARIRENPVVATLVVVGTIVIGIASFTDAVTKLEALFTKQSPAAARTALGQMALPFTADAFVASAGNGDATAVKLFVTAGMDSNAQAADGSTALANAAFNGSVPVVNLLLDAGAHLVDDDGERSALYSAVAGRQHAMIQLLLDRHPGQAAIDSAFVVAVRRSNTPPVRDVEAMRMLAAAGANRRKVAPAAFANLWSNAYDDDATDGAQALLDLGAVLSDLDGTNGVTDVMTPLMSAVQFRFVKTVGVLLAHDARVDVHYRHPDADDDGATALILAVQFASPEIVAALVAKGADVDAKDARGRRAIDYAKGGDPADRAMIVKSLQHASRTAH